MSNWFSNNKVINNISIEDRGLHYGDGLFETIAIREGNLRLWEYHLSRLKKGCKTLNLKMPSDDFLKKSIINAYRDSKLNHSPAIAKIIITAGKSKRGYGRKKNTIPSELFSIFPATQIDPLNYKNGIELTLCKTRLAVNSITAGLKTLNRLEQVLAKIELEGTHFFEGLTMDSENNIICGTMSNIFFVKENDIYTPCLKKCGVRGVMRKHLLFCLDKLDFSVRIQPIKAGDMKYFDEAFIVNSQFGLLPIKKCDDIKWSTFKRTRTIMSLMASNNIIECSI